MANVELSPKETVLLKEILVRYYSDIRSEIADTDHKEFREFLKAREEFMRNLITRLEKIDMEEPMT
jgi:hypothetical protein